MGVRSAATTRASRNHIGACTRSRASRSDLAVGVVQRKNPFIPPLAGVASRFASQACGRGWEFRATDDGRVKKNIFFIVYDVNKNM